MVRAQRGEIPGAPEKFAGQRRGSCYERGPVMSPRAAAHHVSFKKPAICTNVVGPPGTGGGNVNTGSCPDLMSASISPASAVDTPHAGSKAGGFSSSALASSSIFASSEFTCPHVRSDAAIDALSQLRYT